MEIDTVPQTDAGDVASGPAHDDEATALAPESGGARDAIDRAFAKLEAAERSVPNETAKAAEVLKHGAGADEKAVETSQKAIERAKAEVERVKADRDERGRFAKAATADAPEGADDKAPVSEGAKRLVAPERFTPEARAAWEQAPEPVRAEVVQVISELENSLKRHKGESERWNEIAHIADITDRAGVSLGDFMSEYVEFDRLLATDPVAALERAAASQNLTLEQVAQHVLSQSPEARARQQEQSRLEQENAALRRQIEEGQTRAELAERRRLQDTIDSFALEHPRYQELEAKMADILTAQNLMRRTGDVARDLQMAYEIAERLNPLPVIHAQQAQPAQPAAAQTRRAGLSVTGAPGSGSNPATKGPVPTSAKEAIDRAFAAVGL